MNENYFQTAVSLNLSKEEIMQLAINAFNASWLSEQEKKMHVDNVKVYFSELNA